ncbi:MAG: tail fiber domain-containing protein [Chitinophagaceae bacterium]|nr:tail fiber domain-containing protein [Chitinophagaceae bacterium]
MRKLLITMAVIGFSGAAWAQNIGIGTASPAALLHIHGTGTGEGNVLFTGQYKLSNPGNPPVSGQGTRMMWYPDKVAFRVGYVSGDQWDAGNIGDYSVAMGFGTRASGDMSVAMGNASTASGSNAIAIGAHTLAGAYASAAFGIWNVGSGSPASWVETDPIFEIGNGSSASARANAFTVLKNGNIGIGTATPGSSLEVAGQIKLSGGTPGTGKVLTSDANGLASWQTPAPDGLVLPYSNTVTYNLQAFKVVNTEGIGIRSEGNTGVVGISHTAQGSGVLGSYPGASGLGCGVFARNASSEGYGLLAESYSLTGDTYGVYSKAASPEGTGVYGEALATTGINYGVRGITRSNNGKAVFAEATSTTGSTVAVWGRSYSSSGFGIYGRGNSGIMAESDGESGTGLTAVNSHPTGYTTGIYASVSSPNGHSGTFSGGRFYVNGNVGIGTLEPEYRLVVLAAGTTSTGIAAFRNSSGENKVILRQNSDGSGGIQIYKADLSNTILFRGEGVSYINSGDLGIGTTSPTQMLDVAGNGRFRVMASTDYAGPVNRKADGTLTISTSDARLKTGIQPLQNSLDKVLRLQGVSFLWKDNPQMGRRIGFVAQEFEKVFPELSFTNPADGYKGINYAEVTAVLVEAMKELKAENDLLKARLEKLEKSLQQKQ